MPPKVDKLMICHFLEMLHMNMNHLEMYLHRVGDKETKALFDRMSIGLFGPMADLRNKLCIPYDPNNIDKETEPLERPIQ